MLPRVLLRLFIALASSNSQEPNLTESELHLYYHICRRVYNNPSKRALKTAKAKQQKSGKNLVLAQKRYNHSQVHN